MTYVIMKNDFPEGSLFATEQEAQDYIDKLQRVLDRYDHSIRFHYHAVQLKTYTPGAMVEPLKIQNGEYYRTKSGHLVGPMVQGGGLGVTFEAQLEGKVLCWTSLGNVLGDGMNKKDRLVAHVPQDPPGSGAVRIDTPQYYRFQPYKLPTRWQARQGLIGRWQRLTDYGGWENCSAPPVAPEQMADGQTRT